MTWFAKSGFVKPFWSFKMLQLRVTVLQKILFRTPITWRFLLAGGPGPALKPVSHGGIWENPRSCAHQALLLGAVSYPLRSRRWLAVHMLSVSECSSLLILKQTKDCLCCLDFYKQIKSMMTTNGKNQIECIPKMQCWFNISK